MSVTAMNSMALVPESSTASNPTTKKSASDSSLEVQAGGPFAALLERFQQSMEPIASASGSTNVTGSKINGEAAICSRNSDEDSGITESEETESPLSVVPTPFVQSVVVPEPNTTFGVASGGLYEKPVEDTGSAGQAACESATAASPKKQATMSVPSSSLSGSISENATLPASQLHHAASAESLNIMVAGSAGAAVALDTNGGYQAVDRGSNKSVSYLPGASSESTPGASTTPEELDRFFSLHEFLTRSTVGTASKKAEFSPLAPTAGSDHLAGASQVALRTDSKVSPVFQPKSAGTPSLTQATMPRSGDSFRAPAATQKTEFVQIPSIAGTGTESKGPDGMAVDMKASNEGTPNEGVNRRLVPEKSVFAFQSVDSTQGPINSAFSEQEGAPALNPPAAWPRPTTAPTQDTGLKAQNLGQLPPQQATPQFQTSADYLNVAAKQGYENMQQSTAMEASAEVSVEASMSVDRAKPPLMTPVPQMRFHPVRQAEVPPDAAAMAVENANSNVAAAFNDVRSYRNPTAVELNALSSVTPWSWNRTAGAQEAQTPREATVSTNQESQLAPLPAASDTSLQTATNQTPDRGQAAKSAPGVSGVRQAAEAEVMSQSKLQPSAIVPGSLTASALEGNSSPSHTLSGSSEMLSTAGLSMEVLTQVIEHGKLVRSRNLDEVTLQLKPEILGKVAIKASLENGQLLTRISVENVQVAQFLNDNAGWLRNSMGQVEIQVVSFDHSNASMSAPGFNYNGSSQGDAPAQRGAQSRRRIGIQRVTEQDNVAEATTVPATTRLDLHL